MNCKSRCNPQHFASVLTLAEAIFLVLYVTEQRVWKAGTGACEYPVDLYSMDG